MGGFRDSDAFGSSSMGVKFTRQVEQRSSGQPPQLPMANRRMQQQAAAQINRSRAPRDFTQCVAQGAGLPPPPRELNRPPLPFPEESQYSSEGRQPTAKASTWVERGQPFGQSWATSGMN